VLYRSLLSPLCVIGQLTLCFVFQHRTQVMMNQMAVQAAASATSSAASAVAAAGLSSVAVMGVAVAGASVATVQSVSKF
jgi:hypothetical protein